MLQFNGISWRVSLLGEQVILLECAKDTNIEQIHESTYLIEEVLNKNLKDIVPAYHSIAIFTALSIEELIHSLNGKKVSRKRESNSNGIIDLPICYELGMDLERVAQANSLTKEQVIETHLKNTYRSLFVGFTPGFIYADGLDESLACPRLEKPRNRIPDGSVGIAGSQTGIYSLSSPGGWNIIGRTPVKVFDSRRQPPMLIDVGVHYRFQRITKEEFESWES
ncbi:MAG: 5-oxoprolinase subunit PxpB [Pseudomonadales bacterium]